MTQHMQGIFGRAFQSGIVESRGITYTMPAFSIYRIQRYARLCAFESDLRIFLDSLDTYNTHLQDHQKRR
jgi:hypothetical protein